MVKVLYISYDGFEEPLVQSQVLPYLRLLVKKGHTFTLITFDKKRVEHKPELNGITWYSLPYHKRLSLFATGFDISQAKSLIKKEGIKADIVHARGYVSAVIASWYAKRYNVKFLFDIRGFFPDERADCGAWSRKSIVYNLAKWYEMKLFKATDHVVTLTKASINCIKKKTHAPISYIPTCVDLDLFKPQRKQSNDLIYVGALGTWYDLDSMYKFYTRYKKHFPDSKLRILTHSRLNNPPDGVCVERADHLKVAKALSTISAGLCFVKPYPSKKASCPTKLGEYLASGVYSIALEGVGDVDVILETHKCGISIQPTEEGFEKAIEAIKNLPKNQSELCRSAGEEIFDVKKGARVYHEVYESML